MSESLITTNGNGSSKDITAIETALLGGDLSRLGPEERVAYYKATCESLGLNPLTKPFDFLTLNGRMVLYARKDATEQLRKIHRVSIQIVARETIGDVHAVTVRATLPDGRCDESIGAVSIAGLKGDALCNAILKSETKAKRRVTLSICGLGVLDETELETIPQSAMQPQPAPADTASLLESSIERIEEYRQAIAAATTADELRAVAQRISKEPKSLSGTIKADYAKRKKELEGGTQ